MEAISNLRTGTPNKWLITLTVVFGAFMAALDSTIVNIAVPRLQTVFSVDIHNVQWVVTAYLLVMGAVTPLTAYLANNFGSKRIYLISLAVFAVGSALCGFAWDLPSLVAFRAVQAIGGASLIPLSLTIAMRAFPPEQRGIAVSTFGVPTLLAPVLGPVIGGYLITYVDWQLIFFVNLPVAVAGLILGWFVLREAKAEVRSRFDVAGFLTIAYSAVAIIYAVSVVSDDGWGSLTVIGFLGTGLLALMAFVAIELRIISRGGYPLLDLRLFRYRSFSVGAVAFVVYIFAIFGATFLLPIYLQELRGQNPLEAGTTMIWQALTSMFFSLVGGRLADRIGGRVVVISGLIILAVATWQLAGLQLDTAFWWLDVLLAVRGVGLGLASQPLIAAAMADVHGQREAADASAMTTVIRNVIASVGIAVLATMVQSGAASHLRQLSATSNAPADLLQKQATLFAMHDAFVLSIFLVVGAIVAVFFLQGKRSAKPAPAPTIERTALEEKEAVEASVSS